MCSCVSIVACRVDNSRGSRKPNDLEQYTLALDPQKRGRIVPNATETFSLML